MVLWHSCPQSCRLYLGGKGGQALEDPSKLWHTTNPTRAKRLNKPRSLRRKIACHSRAPVQSRTQIWKKDASLAAPRRQEEAHTLREAQIRAGWVAYCWPLCGVRVIWLKRQGLQVGPTLMTLSPANESRCLFFWQARFPARIWVHSGDHRAEHGFSIHSACGTTGNQPVPAICCPISISRRPEYLSPIGIFLSRAFLNQLAFMSLELRS